MRVLPLDYRRHVCLINRQRTCAPAPIEKVPRDEMMAADRPQKTLKQKEEELGEDRGRQEGGQMLHPQERQPRVFVQVEVHQPEPGD